MSDLDIQIDREAGRFQTVVEGHRCVLDFTIEDDVITMDHVGVPSPVGGRGIAGELTRHALDWARDKGLRVVPNCPYVSSWIDRHPDYQDLT